METEKDAVVCAAGVCDGGDQNHQRGHCQGKVTLVQLTREICDARSLAGEGGREGGRGRGRDLRRRGRGNKRFLRIQTISELRREGERLNRYCCSAEFR
jgi:hypothetical protein